MEFTIREKYLKDSPLPKEEIEKRLKAAQALVGLIRPDPSEDEGPDRDLVKYRKSIEDAEAYRRGRHPHAQ